MESTATELNETTEPAAGPLTDALLEEVAAKLVEFRPTWQTVQWLREQYPDFRLLLCSEDDMGEKEAYRSFETFEVFLMAGGLGCACLTDTIEQSVGLIIATIED